MTEEEQQIAIAEACGWKLCRDDNKTWRTPEQAAQNRELLGTENGPWCFESSGPPDYLRDLNAMHEAEKVLGEIYSIESCEYDNWLRSTIGHDEKWRATAAQRAEAFLRTIGKWEDSK